MKKLVPNYPLLWAMFGIARLPAEGEELRGVSDAEVTAWQYVTGGDTVTMSEPWASSVKLVTEVRHGSKVVGRAETTLDRRGAPQREARRPQRPGQARSHIPLDRTGRLCA